MAIESEVDCASAVSLLDLYRRRELSPVEATRLILDRLDALQPKINAFCAVDRDGALAAARKSEERWRRGEAVGRLDGVPVTIKDLILMHGFPTRRGSRLVEPDQDWSEDAPATAGCASRRCNNRQDDDAGIRLEGLGRQPADRDTRNPWDLSRTPGGSSAGAAAACAAGLGPLHVGGDGAGSIRIPSAFTGVFGLKPSFGRVPAHPLSPMGLLAHIGPMARTVADAALLLSVLSRPDHRDPYALPPEDKDYRAGLEEGVRGWRIAYSPTLGYAEVDPEIAAAAAEAARHFEALGAIVEQVEAIFASPREALFKLWAAGTAKLLAGFPADRREVIDPGLVATAEAGERISAVDYLGADLVRNTLARQMAEFHRNYDLLLTAMMPVPALPVGQDLNDPATERHWIDWSPFSYPFNLTRQPAASVPCSLTRAGLPIGLQIVGPLYADDRVLRAARAFETTQPERRPPLQL